MDNSEIQHTEAEQRVLDPEQILNYLDQTITHWRIKAKDGCPFAHYYVDAYQSVRISVYGTTLPEETK